MTQPIDRAGFKLLAAELRNMQDATKERVGVLMERAQGAGFDPAGLRRFVAWKRQDEAKRAQREAIDHQCRYLAGEVDAPAALPIGCELAVALNHYRRGLTVRQVAEEMNISTGKAGKLRELSRMFDVHVHESVDKAPKVDVITPPEVAALPALPNHDETTGEIIEDALPLANKAPAPLQVAPCAWAFVTEARDQFEARKKAEREAERERRRAEREALAAENRRIDADPLDIPEFLDRRARVPA